MQVKPEYLLPREKFGFLSFLDNGVTIASAYSRMKADVTPEIQAQVGAILGSWFGRTEDAPRYGGNAVQKPVEVRQPVDYSPSGNVIPRPPARPSRPHAYDEEDVIVD